MNLKMPTHEGHQALSRGTLGGLGCSDSIVCFGLLVGCSAFVSSTGKRQFRLLARLAVCGRTLHKLASLRVRVLGVWALSLKSP